MRINPSNAPEKKAEYKTKLMAMPDADLSKECEQKIWLSAYANNNPNSCYHWQCDYCYDECQRRERVEIYTQAHADVSRGAA